MARVLFDLQLSNYDEQGRLKLTSDSNFIFTKNMILGLQRQGHKCGLILPYRMFSGYQVPDFCDIMFTENYGTTASRFFVEYSLLEKIQSWKPDLLWTNDPCRVGQYRCGFAGKILAYNHWIFSGLNHRKAHESPYYFRQLESTVKADFLGFNSKFGRDHFYNCATYQNDVDYSAKNVIINPPIDTALLSDLANRTTKHSIPTLVYNHRLSSAPQYSDPIVYLNQLLDGLDEKIGVNGYQLLVSNPSGKDHELLNRENVINIHSENYEEYITAVAKGWIHLTLFTYPGQWSMSMAEAMCLGLRFLHPDHSGYAEMQQKEFGDFWRISPLVENDIELIKTMINGGPGIYPNSQSNYYQRQFSIYRVVSDFLKEVNIGSF